MAGRIPQSFIDDLLSRVDVIDVVDSRVKLKKTGKNYSACCPFHNENTPSFTVSPDKQFYYCFGCGATGSALKFVMEFDGLSFPDAVEKLAADANMEVPREQVSFEVRQEQQHQPLFGQMNKAAGFFEQMLRNHADKGKAISYLQNRGLSGKAAKFFQIGYAPPGWDNLQKHLAPDNNKEIIKQLISCGMSIEKDEPGKEYRTYDRFRDRIMFPIRDARGRVIAFGGRVLGDEKPKYLNSPETPIFQKGRELYGLYEARKIRQKLTRFVIVEGYMDVVALAEFGIHYAVATLGTATSEHHLRRLFKIVPEVIFCFDGDQAGRTAAARAMETVLPLLQDGLQARFLFLPDGEDPDTLVRIEGKDAFEKRLNQSDHLPEFLFAHLKEQVDFDTLDGKARLDQLAAPLINRLPDGMLRQLMRQKLKEETGVESHALTKLEAEAPPPSQEPSIKEDEPPYIEHNLFSLSEPTDQDMEHAYIALRSLVQNPSYAESLDIPSADPVNDYETLLLQVTRLLAESPQKSSLGLLMLAIGKPYKAMLDQIANDTTSRDSMTSVNDIKRIFQRMEARTWLPELAKLHQMNLSKDTRTMMTDEQKARLKELQLRKKAYRL
ncbi:DNA primase [Thalassolituus sp. HI0120]|nr:DNA primase [Thalassolituus sp. HI0120]